MSRLIAIALAPGPEFVRHLSEAWDAGDAVAPIDLRLPDTARETLLEHLAPAVVIDERGVAERHHPRDVEAGDALVVSTSGSTGTPKSVVLTHDAVHALSLIHI